MSYEGGGTIIGPAGPTGPTGPAGGAFSGPTGAVLWYDGSAVTGTTALVYDGFSTISSGPSNNYITLDGMGGIVVAIDEINVGKFVNIYSGASDINLTDRLPGETPQDSNIRLTSDTLELIIGATAQSAGQVLTSDGEYASWQTPSTGATGATGETGAPGTEYTARGSYYYSLDNPPLYTLNDLVVNNNQVLDNGDTPINTPDNNTYVCIQSLGNPYGAPGPLDPSNPTWVDYWQLFASGGATGETGATGATGATGTMDASMSWAWDGAGLSGTTEVGFGPPYTWTTSFQVIRIMTATIPAGWVPKSNTLINLFIWNTFTASAVTTQQYFTYSINAAPEQPLGKTSTTVLYGNQGQTQFFAITGNLIGIPLAAGDELIIRFYGRLFPGSGTHTMNNQNEQAYGAITTGY